MTDRFMKIKKIMLPFAALAIMTSQLAGCAPGTDQELSDASADGVHFAAGSTSDSGLAGGQEGQELSGAALDEYFQKVYDIHLEIHTAATPEGIIQEELDFLASLVDSDGGKLPSDYEEQYRGWRSERLPAEIPADETTRSQEQQSQGQPQQGQQQQTGGQQQGQTQPTQSGGDVYDPFDGYGSYDAMIDGYCERYPELSREEIMQRNPDPAGFHVNEAAARADEAEDRLHGG